MSQPGASLCMFLLNSFFSHLVSQNRFDPFDESVGFDSFAIVWEAHRQWVSVCVNLSRLLWRILGHQIYLVKVSIE